ncbi:MAG: NADH-quinone oxidoreductase subunit C [Actinomycetota bacterium]
MATTRESLRSSGRVEPEAFRERVAAKLGEAANQVSLRFGQIAVTASAERLVEVMKVLKEDPELSCKYFTFLSAIDWQKEGFEVVIAVLSIRHLNTVVVKSRLSADDPRLPTLTSVYQGANWHEREAAEMFGISFDGHPNLVKLYLPEDFIGHPLRKSFKLASRTYKSWPGAKDPAEAEAGGR